jgi:heme/copper-type cytochrome/quinol oxidase subunit 2
MSNAVLGGLAGYGFNVLIHAQEKFLDVSLLADITLGQTFVLINSRLSVVLIVVIVLKMLFTTVQKYGRSN